MVSRAGGGGIHDGSWRIGVWLHLVASRELKGALAQVKAELGAITTLDELRSRTEKMQAALSELHHLLLDSNFVQYAVENRQHALLASASLVLNEVTGGRFGFSADFRIVDTRPARHARRARSPEARPSWRASPWRWVSWRSPRDRADAWMHCFSTRALAR